MIHGFKGEPNGGWRPWLMGMLAKKDIWACSLAMPTPYEPNYKEWIKEIEHVAGEPNEEIILVGHSLGVPAILNYLQSLNNESRICGAILVSGPVHSLPGDMFRPVDNFFEKPWDFNHIKMVCKNFIVIHGDDDNLIPFNHAEELSNKLSCNLAIIKNGCHLSGSNGCYELPEAFEAIMKMIQ